MVDTALHNLDVVYAVDPRVAIAQQRRLAAIAGGRQITWFVDNSTNFSNSSITHSITPPANSIMDSRLYRATVMQLAFTGTGPVSGGGNVVNPGNGYSPGAGSPSAGLDAIRAYPLTQCTTNTNITINGTSVSFYGLDLMSALAHYIGDMNARKLLSSCGSALDQFPEYADGFGAIRNPLNGYGDGTQDSPDPRGSLDYVAIGSPTSTAATYQVLIIEPVFGSPFTYGLMKHVGLAGIQNFIIQFQMGDLTRTWSHLTNAYNGTNLTVTPTIISSALYYTILSPNDKLDPYKLSSRYEYPYFNILSYPSSNPIAVASGASATLYSGNIQLTSIPSIFYCFARQQNSNRTIYTSDVFAAINSISVTWNNQTGLLAGASQAQLYQMSAEHGLDSSYAQFTNYQGSVLCVEFGTDIGLASDEAPGMVGTYQLSVQLNITNINSSSVNYVVYLVPVLPGAFIISGTQAGVTTSLLTKEDLFRASEKGPSSEAVANIEPFGGGFFGDLFSGVKNVLGKVLPIANKIIPIVSTFAPGVGKALGVASNIAQQLTGGNVRRVRHRKYSKAELMRMV